MAGGQVRFEVRAAEGAAEGPGLLCEGSLSLRLKGRGSESLGWDEAALAADGSGIAACYPLGILADRWGRRPMAAWSIPTAA